MIPVGKPSSLIRCVLFGFLSPCEQMFPQSADLALDVLPCRTLESCKLRRVVQVRNLRKLVQHLQRLPLLSVSLGL